MSMKRKNILLIVCDQLSAQALTAWGNSYGSSPHIDKIIEKGVRFETAYTNCPLCQPARASLWTGQYPHQTGVLSNGRLDPVPDVPESVATLGAVFSKVGYKTVHFGKQHDAKSLRGFELFPVEGKEIEDATPSWPVNYDTRQDRNTREQTVAFLSSYADASPYLAVVDLNNPHDICNWIGAFQGTQELISPECDLPPLPDNLYRDEAQFEKLPLPVQYVCCAHNRQAQMGEWDETRIRHYLCAYHHYISRVDAEIGKILESLQGRHDAEDTLIVFTADHGDAMCGRWMGTKHTSFYDETTKIPLAFSGPGINGQGRSVSGLVSLIDLFPTLCDYAGIDLPSTVSGRSLLPCLVEDTQKSPQPYVVSQWHTEWGFTIEPGRMIRSDRYKYTHYLEGDGEELYDLIEDPGEVRNLVEHPCFEKILKEHRAILRDYTERTNDPYFSLEWKADERWRSHAPGYRNHRGIAAPASGD
jgi:choline-sulfatase